MSSEVMHHSNHVVRHARSTNTVHYGMQKSTESNVATLYDKQM